MSNLLPPVAQKRMRAEFRSRFLLAIGLVLLLGAIFFAFALIPAALSVAASSPNAPKDISQQSGNTKVDSAAIAHTKALLGALAPLSATSSLDAVLAALSQKAIGIHIDDISYSIPGGSIALAGHSDSPSDVNTYQEALQSDLRFSNVSVPVSALLGSQNGSFTITMKVNP